MARYRGTFTLAANYDILKAAPLDARSLVEFKSDLTNPNTWRQSNGDIWVYSGMVVAVASDLNAENNGLYVLVDAQQYTLETSWIKLASTQETSKLQQQIDNIIIPAGKDDIVVDTIFDLPVIGDKDITYYINEDASIRRWDDALQEYRFYGTVSSGECKCPDYIEGEGIDIISSAEGQRMILIENDSISDNKIKSVSVNKLIQEEGTTIILNGGKAYVTD